MEVEKATVLGGGAFGTAMAQVLARNGISVTMWVREPEVAKSINEEHVNEMFLAGVALNEKVCATNDVIKALEATQAVYLVIPTPFLRTSIVKLRADLPTGVPIVCCTKGIETSTLLTPYEILVEELPGKYHAQLAAVSGPSFAKEVANGMPTSVLCASLSDDVATKIQRIMSNKTFRVTRERHGHVRNADFSAVSSCAETDVASKYEPLFTVLEGDPANLDHARYTGNDLIGAELCGAIKNVLAIACGAANALYPSSNTAAALITRGLVEMTRLALAKGANPATMTGLAGVGDLLLTCTSTQSRNFTVGARVAKGEDWRGTLSVAEGVKTSESVHRLAAELGVDMPICEQVYQVLHHNKPVAKALEELQSRPLTAEYDAFRAKRARTE